MLRMCRPIFRSGKAVVLESLPKVLQRLNPKVCIHSSDQEAALLSERSSWGPY